MVVSDQAQMSSYNLESVMQASSRGDAPFAVVGASLNKAYFALMTRKDVASVTDLKGKTFAVSQIGDPPYNYTSAFLRKFGMTPRDVQWIAAGADATGRAAALSAGRADATLLTPPAYFRLEEAGFKSLGNLADHDDIFAATTYLMKKTTIAASPRLPEQLIKAHAEAIKRFYDDKAFAVKAYQAYDKQATADVERLYDGYAKANVLERVPYVLAPALQAVIDQQSDAKLLAQMKAFDFHTVIDNSVVARLVKEGFFEKLFGPGVKAEEDRKAKLGIQVDGHQVPSRPGRQLSSSAGNSGCPQRPVVDALTASARSRTDTSCARFSARRTSASRSSPTANCAAAGSWVTSTSRSTDWTTTDRSPAPGKGKAERIPKTGIAQLTGLVVDKVRQKKRLTRHEVDFLLDHSPGDIKMTVPTANQFPAIAYRKGLSERAYASYSDFLWDVVPVIKSEIQCAGGRGRQLRADRRAAV